jgi:hypothetical protein
MPTIGDINAFAVEFHLLDPHGGVWLFGKVGYWICGNRVGDFDEVTSLRDFLFSIEQGRRDHGRRRSAHFDGMAADEVMRQLDEALFGGDDAAIEELALEDQWARHRICPEVDVFDRWRIYLVESETAARIIYDRHGSGAAVAEYWVASGECDRVLAETCRQLGAIYERSLTIEGQVSPGGP